MQIFSVYKIKERTKNSMQKRTYSSKKKLKTWLLSMLCFLLILSMSPIMQITQYAHAYTAAQRSGLQPSDIQTSKDRFLRSIRAHMDRANVVGYGYNNVLQGTNYRPLATSTQKFCCVDLVAHVLYVATASKINGQSSSVQNTLSTQHAYSSSNGIVFNTSGCGVFYNMLRNASGIFQHLPGSTPKENLQFGDILLTGNQDSSNLLHAMMYIGRISQEENAILAIPAGSDADGYSPTKPYMISMTNNNLAKYRNTDRWLNRPHYNDDPTKGYYLKHVFRPKFDIPFQEYGGFRIRKTDSNTGTGLAGAEFDLKSGNQVRLHFTTTSSGYTSSMTFDPGQYTLVETKAPTGYQLDPTPRSLTITSGQTNSVYWNTPIQNTRSNGSVQVTKKDAGTGLNVQGAVFDLSQSASFPSGSTIRLTTRSDGTTVPQQFNVGDGSTVYVREVSVPAPYLLDTSIKQVTLTSGQTVGVTFENSRAQGRLEITKQGANNAPLQNVVFEVRNSSNTVVDTITTNAQGFAQTVLLPLGTYTVKETSVPSPYVLDPTSFTMILEYSNMSTPVVTASRTVSNNQAQGRIEITKQGTNNAAVQGAVFSVKNSSNVIVATLTTNSQGKAQTDLLPLGNYTITETSVPSPYILDSTPINVSLVYANMTTPIVVSSSTITNEAAQGRIELTKQDENNTPIQGAIFEVRNSSNILVDTLTTNAQGKAQSVILPLGTYTLIETFVPSPYILDASPKTVSLNYQDMNTPIVIGATTISNETAKGRIEINKTGELNLPLQNVVFEIRNSSNTLVDMLTTDFQGKAQSTILPLGTYTITETSVPVPYILNSTPRTITLTYKDMNTPVVISTANITNEMHKGQIDISKKDAETVSGIYQGDSNLSGIKFAIINRSQYSVPYKGTMYATGRVIDILSTNNLGNITTGVKSVPYGSYQVVELPADTTNVVIGQAYNPSQLGSSIYANNNGYIYKPFSETLTISGANETVTYNVRNNVLRGGVAVSKVLTTTNDKEEGDVNLQGLRYVVVSNSDNPIVLDGTSYSRGQIVAILTTNISGNAQTAINRLPYGRYIVYELRRDAANPSLGTVYANLYKGVSIYASVPGRDDVLWKEGSVPVTINEANTMYYAAEVNGRDITNMDSHGNLVIQKQDTDYTTAQGNASLAGIRYAVINRSQYKVVYGETTFAPNRVIDILTTDSNGRARTSAKSLPYGTYEVVELPVDTTNVVIGSVFNNSQLGSSIYANNNGYLYQPYTETLSIREDDHVITYTNKDDVLRGGINISKVLTSTNDKQEGDTSLAGLRYVIVTDSVNPVVVNGITYFRGQIVSAHITDANGNEGTNNQFLPYGKYIVYELRQDAALPALGEAYSDLYKGVSIYASPEGRNDVLWKEGAIVVNIDEHDTMYYAYEVNDKDITNRNSHGNLTIQKLDTENRTEQGDANLSEIRYAVINRSRYKVIYNGTAYAPGQVIDILTTDNNGRTQTASQSLAYGTYEVVELPVDTTEVEVGKVFNVDQLGSSIYANNNGYLYQPYNETLSIKNHNETLEFSNEDNVVRGTISITKFDSQTERNERQGDGSLEGIKYAVVNRSLEEVILDNESFEPGEVVEILTLDNTGKITSSQLTYGSYEVFELRQDSTLEPHDIYDNNPKQGVSIYSNNSYLHTDKFDNTVDINDPNTYQVASQNTAIRIQNNDQKLNYSNYIVHGTIEARKFDAETTLAEAQGDGSLEGIKYAIINRSSTYIHKDGIDFEPGEVVVVITTMSNGRTLVDWMPYGTYQVVELRKDATIVSGDVYDNSDKLGNSIYSNDEGYLHTDKMDETVVIDSPETYLVTDKSLSVREQEEIYPNDYSNFLVRGDIEIVKYDRETRLNEPQGICSFAGIRYAIVNNSRNYVLFNGHRYETGQVISIVELDESGKVRINDLGYGTYDIHELRQDATIEVGEEYEGSLKLGESIYSNDSYLHTDKFNSTVNIELPMTYTVTTQTRRIRLENEFSEQDFSNFPVRGDIKINKYDIDGYPEAYIPFLVSLLDPYGNKVESHVILTDANGVINTRTRNNKAVPDVNTLDQYASNGIYNGPLNDEAANVNIWFGSEGYVVNRRGSALYGNYLVEELQCENNFGKDLLTAWLAVDKEEEIFEPDNVLIDLNVVIESQALDVKSRSNAVSLGENTVIRDTLQFSHLKTYNAYEVVAELVNVKKDGTKVSVGFSDPHMFIPDQIDDTNTSSATLSSPLVVEFEVDTSNLELGSYVAIVNRLYYINRENDRILIKVHNEFYNVESQKLVVPEITSDANEFITNSKIGSIDPNPFVADYVTYTNFGDRMFYTLVEELFYSDGSPVYDVNGNLARVEKRIYIDYTLDETIERDNIFIGGKDGQLLMPKFELDPSELAGKTISIKQSLLNEISRETILEHNSELNIEDQNIRWLDIRTVAGSTTGVQGIVPCDENVTIVDTLTYENCAEDTDVKIKIVVIEKETKEVVAESITEKSLTVGNGTLQTSVAFNTLPYEGKQLVIFEYVYKAVNGENILIAKHEDINDSNQTVMIPKIRTTLESVIDNNRYKSIKDKGIINLIDTVTYENLKVGQSYTFVAELMNKSTGANVLDKDGNKVTGSTTIVPESTSGSVEVEMTFEVEDSLATTWNNVDAYVAFEEVWGNSDIDNLRYAFHKDLEDEDQTVIVPKIKTTALGKDSESKNVISKDSQVIVDKVELKDFHVGDTLTLVIVAHDPVTGNALLDSDGNTFTNSKTFVYTGQEFELIECEIDAADLGGKNVVFFEYVHIGGEVKDETIIAYEDDQHNFKQTVRIPDGYTNAYESNTMLNMAFAKEISITDIVTYENVEPNRTYKLVGELVDKETQEVVATAEKEVSLTTENGEIELVFEFDATEFEGRTVVAFETLYELNGTAIFEHKDINDEAQSIHIPKIRTEANAEDTEIKVTGAKTTTIIKDIVTYNNLIADGREYRVKGHLVDKSNGNPILINGNKITASTTFVPTDPDGEVEVVFEFDSSALAGTTMVVFEDLFFEDVHLATHSDIEDDSQTIYIPKIRTKVFDENTLLDHTLREEVVTIVDTVSYTNLLPGIEYTVTGKLMNKKTGEPILVNGEEVISSTTFTPEEDSGTVEVKFTFDASDLIGTTLVAFEKLFYNNIEIANHEDLTDEDQTDYIPNILTEALGGSTNDHVELASENTTIIDIVTYEGLKPHTKYEVKGKLMDQETGEPILVNGEELTSSVTFVTGEANEGQVSVSGEIELVFAFDARTLAGKAVVVFEDLYHEDKLVAVHADINDESQTVYLPKIKTNANAEDTEIKVTGSKEFTTIIDTIKYEKLLVNKEYKVNGYLVNKETGEPILVSGEKVIASTTFTPTSSDGEVEVVFEFDSSALAGTTIVVFEDLFFEDVLIASHKDINDTNQTVYIPKIRTALINKDNDLDHILCTDKVTIIDTVSYNNLLPGVEYTMSGKLMDKETEEPMLINGNEIIGSTTFIATAANGFVEIAFEFDASELGGKVLVAYEKLFYNDIEIASHEDINDENQTVYIPQIYTNAVGKNTKDHIEQATEFTTIIDTVTYSGLKPNSEYIITGTLMDKESGEPILINEEEVTTSALLKTGFVSFGQVSVSGSIDLEFVFDAREFAGKAVVVFEDLYHEDKLVAVHADINDENQTVYLPFINTFARDKSDKDQTIDGTQTEQIIVDTIMYKGLIAGKRYTIEGRLVDKSTNNYIVDKDGNVIVAHTSFIAEEPNGETTVEFVIDASLYAGKKLVAFEKLFVNGVQIAVHEDIEDEDQTVSVSMLLDVRIAKADHDDIKHFLKGAEITVFNEDGTIAKDINGNDCVGLTDENGQVQFTLLYDENNSYYVKETKAPQGYHINEDKFEVKITGKDKLGVDLIRINVLDKVIVIPPPTGENVSPLVKYGLIAIGSSVVLFALSFILYRKRRKDEELA
jgi:hypothetical protein